MPGSVEVSLSLNCHLQNNNDMRQDGSIRRGGTNPLDKRFHTVFPPHHIHMSCTLAWRKEFTLQRNLTKLLSDTIPSTPSQFYGQLCVWCCSMAVQSVMLLQNKALAVGVATGLLAERLRNRSSVPGKGKYFSHIHSIQTGFVHTQPPIQYLKGDFSLRGKTARVPSCLLTTVYWLD
jgi:hypothetical protein